ncbi:carbohydrate ABC transporter permease [Paenibacillus cymbidii]|uniref:carbohydrate ABC transporter permease n=1 Tax=Paenibacillus cymbidii TaxID=1639034 RepID=UPI0010804D35|nr:carbohydrate ABC transporter permease [Paenibacillus cymbidii]
MNNRLSTFDVVNYSILILIALACAYPFVNIIAVSLSDGAYVQAGKVFLYPRGFNLETYEQILFRNQFGIPRAMYNSVLYAVLGTVVAVSLTYVAAYCLSRQRFVGRHVFMLLIFFTMLFDGGLIPHYLLVKNLGLVGTIWSMVIPGAINVFLLIVTRTFLDTLPVELEESAFIDGANDFRVMRSIFIPLSAPIIATIAVFYAVGIWNAYLSPIIYLQKTKLYPIQVMLYQLTIQPSATSETLPTVVEGSVLINPVNLRAAIIFIGMFPILLVYPFAQKYFTKGIMLGAIKG